MPSAVVFLVGLFGCAVRRGLWLPLLYKPLLVDFKPAATAAASPPSRTGAAERKCAAAEGQTAISGAPAGTALCRQQLARSRRAIRLSAHERGPMLGWGAPLGSVCRPAWAARQRKCAKHLRAAGMWVGWPKQKGAENGREECAAARYHKYAKNTCPHREPSELHALFCTGWVLLDSVRALGSRTPFTARCFFGDATIASADGMMGPTHGGPCSQLPQVAGKSTRRCNSDCTRNGAEARKRRLHSLATPPEPSHPTTGADAGQSPRPGVSDYELARSTSDSRLREKSGTPSTGHCGSVIPKLPDPKFLEALEGPVSRPGVVPGVGETPQQHRAIGRRDSRPGARFRLKPPLLLAGLSGSARRARYAGNFRDACVRAVERQSCRPPVHGFGRQRRRR